MAVARDANIITIPLGTEETLSLPENNEYGIKKLSIRPPSAGTTSITGTAKIATGSDVIGGTAITLTSTDTPVTFIALDGETIQGLLIENDASAACAIVAYK